MKEITQTITAVKVKTEQADVSEPVTPPATNLNETIPDLKTNNFQLIGAALGGENLYTTPFKKKTALVMGSESHGISKELSDQLDKEVLIPQFGKTESLNVAMATGIILSHYKANTGGN